MNTNMLFICSGLLLFNIFFPVIFKSVLGIHFYKHETNYYFSIANPITFFLSLVISSVVICTTGINRSNSIPISFALFIYISLIGLYTSRYLIEKTVIELPKECIEQDNYIVTVTPFAEGLAYYANIPNIEEPVRVAYHKKTQTSIKVVYYYDTDLKCYVCYQVNNIDKLNLSHLIYLCSLISFIIMPAMPIITAGAILNSYEILYTETGECFHNRICPIINEKTVYTEKEFDEYVRYEINRATSEYKPCKICKPQNSSLSKFFILCCSFLLSASLTIIVYKLFKEPWYLLMYRNE